MDQLAHMLDRIDLHEVGTDTFRSTPVEGAQGGVFGGELLAQAITAAHRVHPEKGVRAIHTLFARGVAADLPADIRVERMHAGRNLASVTVSFVQADRVCARSLVMMDVEEPDLIRHARPMPVVPKPDPNRAAPSLLGGPETIIVGEVDIDDPQVTGPPTLQLWVRFPGAPNELPTSRALLSYATDGWLIAAALRPHTGLGQSMAHIEISTGVVSHSLSFEDSFRADEWLLIDHESVHAGNGRAFGRGEVFAEDGRVVATFSQDAIVRHWPGGRAPSGGHGSAL